MLVSPHGYWFYVMGRVPDYKDPSSVDEKLIAKYGIAVSESTRGAGRNSAWRICNTFAIDRLFVILATHGRHFFKENESGAVRDIRRVPIKFQGYSISYRPGGRTRQGR